MFKEQPANTKKTWRPGQIIAVSFATVIAIGTLLLTMPFSSASGKGTSFLDALFTATSATCVTGLVTVDTGTHWSVIGQIIILMMIQIGGLGFVTFTTFFNLIIRKKLGLRNLALLKESIHGENVDNVVPLVKMVIIVSMVIELIGAFFLGLVFVPKYGLKGIYYSIFIAISAFCNAGIDPLGFESPFVSLGNYYSNPLVLFTVSCLIIIGGLGFMVWNDIYINRKSKAFTTNTKIVISFTLGLIAVGTVAFLILEWFNPLTLGPLTFFEKLTNGVFQSITTRTAGFNTVDLASMYGTTKVIFCILMFIGACPGSTGGGIKVTTIAVIIVAVASVLQGDDEAVIFGHRIDRQTVYKSLAVFVISLLAVIGVFVFITAAMDLSHIGIENIDVFFEAVSAFGTVGLSTGVTAAASSLTKMVLVVAMYIGRVGPVSFALALAIRPQQRRNVVLPDAKIIVG